MNESRAWRQALVILAASTVLRLVLGALVPLFPDETYYWDWSRTLGAGYFDHGPMIAALIRAGTLLLGHTTIGVRLLPILAGTGAALAIACTARELGGDVAARLATLVFACLPLATVGLVLATPDAPMLCAAAWSLFFVVRALHIPAASGKWQAVKHWALAGLCVGLAMASKYTSVLIPASLALALLTHPRLQNSFGEPGPYVAVAVASLVLLPTLWWNASHDWVSFRFQFAHGLGDPQGGLLGALHRELELIGGQLGLVVSPILFILLVAAIKRSIDPTPDGLRLLLGVVASSCLAFFVFSASRRSVEANWPAIAYLPAVVLLATEPPRSRRAHRWLDGGLVLGAALTLAVYVHALFPVLPVPAPRDQVAKAFGWQSLADKVDKRREFLLSRAAFGKDLFFAADRYQDASELAWHLADHPRVLSLNLAGRANQYDLWPTFRDRAATGAALLLVLDDELTEPRVIRRLTCCFQRIDEGESVALMRRDAFIARKRLWVLQGWNGSWPGHDQPVR